MQITIFEKHPQKTIFFLSLIVLIIAQYSLGISDYTARFVAFVQWMQLNGPTPFPMTHGAPYPDYMITYFMMVYGLSLLFGHLSVLTFGIPFCLAGTITVLYVYKLGALYDESWGLYGALFVLFTWKVIDGTNTLELDIFTMMAMAMACYFVTLAHLKKNKTAFGLIFVSLVIGFLFRGPIGFIAPGFVVFLYYLLYKQWKTLFIYSLIAGLLCLFCVATLLLSAYLYGGNDFLQQVIQFQGVERLSHDHAPRYYFYFSVALINYSFTVFFSIATIALLWKKIISPKSRNERFLQFLVVGFIGILVLMTIPNTKKPRYILSIVPAISLIAAYLFMLKNQFIKTKKVLHILCFALPLVGFIATIGIIIFNFFGGQIAINSMGSLLSLTTLALFSIKLKCKGSPTNHYLRWLLIGALSYIAINSFMIEPLQFHHAILTHDDVIFLSYF